jgi:hypothetical protein
MPPPLNGPWLPCTRVRVRLTTAPGRIGAEGLFECAAMPPPNPVVDGADAVGLARLPSMIESTTS